MRGVDICRMLSNERIEYNLPHRFKNKKAAPPRSISDAWSSCIYQLLAFTTISPK